MDKSEYQNEKIKFLNNKNKITISHRKSIYKDYYLSIRNNCKIIIIYKYFFLFILIINFIITFNTEDLIYNKEIEGSQIFKKGKTKKYLNIDLVNKFNSYINICKHNTLTNIKSYSLMKDPKISAIMPIYNGGKYLNYSLSSIQNQNMKDIEIILIDDHSTDDSIIIIEDYMKKDSRIRLIKNNKNKKILYSKIIK